MKILAILLLTGLLLFGCTQPAAQATPVPTTLATATPQATVLSTPVATVSKSATATPFETPSSTPEATATPTVTPAASVSAAQNVQEFTVETDDNGWYPTGITVKKGIPVKLTIQIRTTNVYFGGADIKSDEFNFPNLKAGDVKVAEFTPTRSFGVENRWPNNAVLKGTLQIGVE